MGVGIRQCFEFTPEGEGKRTDISSVTGAMKMIFGTNTNRPPSYERARSAKRVSTDIH